MARSVGGGIIPPPNLLMKGKDKYLYRAVDSDGHTLDLLTAKRDAIIGLKNAAYSKAIDELKADEELSLQVELRQNKYLNNRVEQDQRTIK